MADRALTPAQLKRARQKFGSPMGAAPVKDATETKSDDDTLIDLRSWKARAIKAVKAGKAADVRFESEAIPPSEQARIRAALAGAGGAGDVAAIFETKAQEDTTGALIDGEWDSAMAWAKKAMEK